MYTVKSEQYAALKKAVKLPDSEQSLLLSLSFTKEI